MTDIPSIQLVRLQQPPTGHDESSYAKWRTQFRALMAELKHTAKKVVARTQNPTVMKLLGAVQDCRADPIAFGLVEHLYEFTAFHVSGRSGCTIAESAIEAAELLPEGLRHYLEPLAASHWDLYEVTGLADSGAVGLRRLHDDEMVELDALEMPQAFVAGTVQALRLFDAGGFTAAPVALALEQQDIAALVSRLEVEQPQAFGSRAEYMFHRGSALILSHALQCHVRRLSEDRPMPEPPVSLVESTLPAPEWKRLEGAFSLLEAAIGNELSSLSPLVLSMSDGRVLRVEKNGPAMALMVFDAGEEHESWVSSGHAKTFVRVWRASAGELFDEDVDLLQGLGLEPVRNGAVVAMRLDEGCWADVDEEHVSSMIDACRWTALRVRTEADQAA
jgi:hypothetical protein